GSMKGVEVPQAEIEHPDSPPPDDGRPRPERSPLPRDAEGGVGTQVDFQRDQTVGAGYVQIRGRVRIPAVSRAADPRRKQLTADAAQMTPVEEVSVAVLPNLKDEVRA